MLKWFKIFLALAIIFASVFALSLYIKNPQEEEYSFDDSYYRENEVEIGKEKDIAQLVFVGDIMLSRGIGYYMKKTDDYFKYWREVYGFLSNADIAFANLESPISDKGTNVGSIYSFRADPKVIYGLKESGIDIVSFANNHVWDWGKNAFLDTLDRLSKAGIHYVGAGTDYDESHSHKSFEKNGIKISYLAYTDLVAKWLREKDATPSVAGIEKEIIAEDIKKAKQDGADIVVVSFHFGEEYKTHHNKYQENIARFAIDNGAKFVIGHHPHVAEDIEFYKDGFIAYSLGNFIFDQNFSEETSWGLGIRADVSKDEILSVEKIIFEFDKEFVPKIKEVLPINKS